MGLVYSEEWYAKNKQRIMRNTAAMRQRNLVMLRELKAAKGCERCGYADFRALEFHHRVPEEKSFALVKGVQRGLSKARLLAEVAKCEVLCANCHAIEHFHRE